MQKQPTKPSGQPYSPLNDFAVPGQSLTVAKGEYNWEQPPMHTNPDSAMAEILDKISKPETMGRLFSLLENDITVVALVDAIVLTGFAQGRFNPNVAELIKPDLREFVMLLADKADIKYKEGAVKEKSTFDKALDELQERQKELKGDTPFVEPADEAESEPIEMPVGEKKGLMMEEKSTGIMAKGDM